MEGMGPKATGGMGLLNWGERRKNFGIAPDKGAPDKVCE